MISARQADRVPVWKNTQLLLSLGVCVAGIGINLAGAKLAALLPFPLFLDAIGTILAASLGGYIPGMAAGFATNIINSLSDYTSAYYGVLNVLIALFAAYFSHRKADKKAAGAVLSIVAYALIGGALGSLLTWFLYGADVSSGLAQALYDGGIGSAFLAQLTADFLIDLADKTISVGAALAVLALLPLKFKERFAFWQERGIRIEQKPFSLRGLMTHTLSLGTKIMLLISFAILLLAVVVTSICFRQFHDAALDTQIHLSAGMAKMVSDYIDGDRVEDFLANGEAAEGYSETKTNLEHILHSNGDLEFLYVYKILPDGCHVVFDLDTEELEGEPAGTVIPFDEAFMELVPALLAGESIDPLISDETYGWLLTAYHPVYDSEGRCQCYAAVDLSMPRIIADQQVFLTRIGSLFMGFFILITAMGMNLARRGLIRPINSMAAAAGKFAFDSDQARADSVEGIRRLRIRSGDEIENLYHALVATTEETVRYIADAQEKNEKISKLQNGLIVILADMVESRDQCTGDHVRKTAAYTRIIMEQMRRDGMHRDVLTDDYIRDVVMSAPLHDVGKIHVSDMVLNKPGRLTDEEYVRMKEHSTAGSEIIRNAISTMSGVDIGYLKEAQNLAQYHHERWDGKGYPSGLKGEEIPLSARIMAVADVFDALVSRRSYKEGFPFDKAMDIIKEGSGTHFDPDVVAAFFEAQEEVHKVADEYNSHD